MSTKIIIDTDLGTDDAFALILLLETLKKNIEIKAITCVNGNTTVENVFKNVQRILKLCDRDDIPIYLGSTEPILHSTDECKNYFHGKDGFGDIKYDDDNSNTNYNYNAVTKINEIVLNNPKQISLICLGPLTNIALAIKINPLFRENVKDIFIMGGNYKGIGNVTSSAEYNFHVDPEAAFIVLQFLKCPITLLPWEPCLETVITFDWRYNILGKSKHPTIKLLNTAEKNIYSVEEKFWNPCDAYLAGIFIDPAIIKGYFTGKISVELHGHKTRAQMLINHCEKDLESNAFIVTEINVDIFKTLLLQTFNK